MKLLLDTHVWIWALSAPENLDKRTTAALADKNNELWLSPISVWEFLTLTRKGRLSISGDAFQWLDEAMARAPLREAPLTREIAIESQRLGLPHWDPADRFIAATARCLDLVLVTADSKLKGSRQLPIF